MDFLDTIDSLVANKPIESSHHPVGDFPATVVGIEKKQTDKGKHLWEIKLQTSHGKTRGPAMWAPDQDQVMRAKGGDQIALKQLVSSVNAIKEIFIGCGVVDQQTAESWTWRTIIGNIDSGVLIGKSCELSIQKGRKPETKDKTYYFINRLKAGQLPPQVQQVAAPQQQQQQPAAMPQPLHNDPGVQPNVPVYQQLPPQPQGQQQMQPPPMATAGQPGANPSLDQIPF